MAKRYCVAVNSKEASEIVQEDMKYPEDQRVSHTTLRAAHAHLREVQAPPTDPYYAAQYRVYTVKLPATPASAR